MSIATKLGLAYSMYHGNPYRSFREVILPDARYQDSFRPEREKKFFSSLIFSSSPHKSTSSEKLVTEVVPQNPESDLCESFIEKKKSPTHDKISLEPSSLSITIPTHEPQPSGDARDSSRKIIQTDIAIQVNFLPDENLSSNCPDAVFSTEIPSFRVGTSDNEVQELKSAASSTPRSSHPTKTPLFEKEFVPCKEEPNTVVHPKIEPITMSDGTVENEQASQEMERGSACSFQGGEISKWTAKPIDNMCTTPHKDVIDIGVGTEEVESATSLLPAPQVSGVSEEKRNSLDNSLQHMIPAACLSDVVDCILKKIQVHNVHAVALDDLIQQLTKHIPSAEQAEAPATPARKPDNGETQKSHENLDTRTKHELAIYLYGLRDEVQRLATQLDATENSFQRSLREHALKRNNTRKIEVEIVRGYEEDPIPYKKLPFRPASVGVRAKTEATENESNYAEYEDDFTFDEEGTNSDSHTSDKGNSILSSFSSSSSRAKSRRVHKTAQKKIARKRSNSSSFSTSAMSKTMSSVLSLSTSSSTRRSTVLSSISSSFSTSSSLSSSVPKPSLNTHQRARAKDTKSRFLEQKSSQKAITNNESHFMRKKEKEKSSSSFSSSSRISSSPTSQSSSKNGVLAMNDAAIKDFWARRTNQVQTTEKDLSSSSLSTISSRS